MAEAAIILAVKKIGATLGGEVLNSATSLLATEVSLLAELPSSTSRIQSELVIMQSFLNQLSDYNHQVLQVWLGQVRKLACCIEDIVDDYVYVVARQRESESGGYVAKLTKRPRTLSAFHGIADKLKEAEANLVHLSQMKDRWVQMAPTGGLGNTSKSAASENHIISQAISLRKKSLWGSTTTEEY